MRINKVVASYLRVAAEDLAGARLLAQAKNRNAIYMGYRFDWTHG